ncbi:disulfide bond formation protein B [uncultured Shewanella sp.]|uniref:disulfide bond formation protein B n=1 Tax=uncultured Shewanella sp. TaxID=173975 RepID=UPI002601BE25|nr:disulfide bond formation protein B [uncultured Shewanella sp.]
MSTLYQTYLNKGINFITWLECVGIICVLITASVLQFYLVESPCPLCLLQRSAMMLIVLPLLMNLSYERRIIHYSLSSLGALLLGCISLRQILLHIDGPLGSGYGYPFLGYHLYTWNFIMAVIVIAINLIVCAALKQYSIPALYEQSIFGKRVVLITAILFIAIAGFNVITAYNECGFLQC